MISLFRKNINLVKRTEFKFIFYNTAQRKTDFSIFSIFLGA